MKKFGTKIRNFFKTYWKSIVKIVIIVAILTVFAVAAYFILRALGFTTADDYIALRDRLGDSVWFWIIIGLVQIAQVLFVPISNQIVTVPLAVAFGEDSASLLHVWITSWVSIWIATIILYLIGRFGGEKILRWILGGDKEKVDMCTRWIARGWWFYPLGMLLPLPDDIVTVLAGTARYKWWFVVVCSFFTRGIDTACSVWGFGFLTHFWWGWIVIVVGVIILIALTALFWRLQKRGKL